MKQLWFCDNCRMLGILVMHEHAGVMEVIHRMGENHKRAAPRCEQPWLRLRSIVPAAFDNDTTIIYPLDKFQAEQGLHE